jgi:hypothetical protein
MKNIIPYFFMALLAAFLMGCPAQNDAEQGEETQADPMAETTLKPDDFPTSKGGITLSYLKGSPAFADARLEHGPLSVSETGEADFNFTVTNYELGQQTPDAADKGLANSGKGQHIHLIVNNGPYFARYEPSFTHQLDSGNNVILAFLSRSYHESVKNANAYVLTQASVGEGVKPANLDAPHMFYSRPKGTYKGDGANKVLLDFFLHNCDLSPDGNKVRATINGTSFVIAEWTPLVMEGLPMGENTVKLELLDAKGELVASPFNPVERTFMLEAEGAEM